MIGATLAYCLRHFWSTVKATRRRLSHLPPSRFDQEQTTSVVPFHFQTNAVQIKANVIAGAKILWTQSTVHPPNLANAFFDTRNFELATYIYISVWIFRCWLFFFFHSRWKINICLCVEFWLKSFKLTQRIRCASTRNWHWIPCVLFFLHFFCSSLSLLRGIWKQFHFRILFFLFFRLIWPYLAGWC